MDRRVVLDRLGHHTAELKAMGLKRLSLFGSTARGEAHAGSDVDLAAVLDETAMIDLFRFAALSQRLSTLLGAQVDLVIEPARSGRMQAQIDRDRLRVY